MMVRAKTMKDHQDYGGESLKPFKKALRKKWQETQPSVLWEKTWVTMVVHT
ncbi:hypothetical protein Tco_0485875, partial [Tanacetum coccineum]